MHIILIPGLWLDGSSWERVVPALEQAGHRPHPLTLPGLESKEADRSTITLRDHVAAVVRVIDSLDPAEGKVAVVGHSGGSGIGHAAVDARPDRVARAIYIGGFPTGDGDPVVDGFSVTGGDLPLPDWSDFDDADLADLDDQARAEFRARAVPSPAGLVRDRQQLSDQRRYEVPVTVICPEFTSELLRGWMDKGMGPVRELTQIHEVELVDLPAGHWPQFTRPDDLAQAILGRVPASGRGPA